MEVTKKPKIKSIPYEEFTDNETLEKLVRELNAGGANVALGVLDDFVNWGRSNSLWPLTFATSCCGIEFMALGAARYYECGIPTRGKSWMQFRVGYYLFAILFLMFEVETVFLFPWAVITRELGVAGLFSVLFFLIILILGLAYAWRKGALEWK